MGRQSLATKIENLKENIFTSIRDGDTSQVEEDLRQIYGEDIDFSCTNLMSTFSINGLCQSKKDAKSIETKLYSLFKNTFYIHTHGLSHDGDDWYFYINLMDRMR